LYVLGQPYAEKGDARQPIGQAEAGGCRADTARFGAEGPMLARVLGSDEGREA